MNARPSSVCGPVRGSFANALKCGGSPPFGEKAVDVFYVTDLTNKKITSPQRHNAIRARLLAVLGGDADVRASGSDAMTRT